MATEPTRASTAPHCSEICPSGSADRAKQRQLASIQGGQANRKQWEARRNREKAALAHELERLRTQSGLKTQVQLADGLRRFVGQLDKWQLAELGLDRTIKTKKSLYFKRMFWPIARGKGIKKLKLQTK